MNKRLIHGLLVLGLVLPACKKEETETPDVTNTPEPDPEPEPEGPPPIPAQDPDPPELAALYERLLAGDYEAVATEAATLRGSLTSDTQIRANAIAGSIQALAASEGIPENAKEPAEKALADADRLADPEVQQLANIAHASYLLGVQDGGGAQAAAEKAIGLAGPRGGHAQIVLAMAHLNQAFGTDDEGNETVVAPERFDSAYAAYQAASADPSQLIQARAQEGLAEVERRRGTKESKAKACEHVKQAWDLYGTGGATETLREGPKTINGTLKCKNKLK